MFEGGRDEMDRDDEEARDSLSELGLESTQPLSLHPPARLHAYPLNTLSPLSDLRSSVS